MTGPRKLHWTDIAVGQAVEQQTCFTQADHDAFAALSGDTSRIHFNPAFAAANGFQGPVVFGGLLATRLSWILGMFLPGDLGLLASWQIDFHTPLYVGETAIYRATVAHKSEVARIVSLKVDIRCGERLIARARVQSRVLQEENPATGGYASD